MGYYNNLSIDTRTWGEATDDTWLDRTDNAFEAKRDLLIQDEQNAQSASANGRARDNLFCVVYRTGGTENFQWRRTLGMTKNEAQAACESTRRMGYRAFVVDYQLSISIGLPDTYEWETT